MTDRRIDDWLRHRCWPTANSINAYLLPNYSRCFYSASLIPQTFLICRQKLSTLFAGSLIPTNLAQCEKTMLNAAYSTTLDCQRMKEKSSWKSIRSLKFFCRQILSLLRSSCVLLEHLQSQFQINRRPVSQSCVTGTGSVDMLITWSGSVFRFRFPVGRFPSCPSPPFAQRPGVVVVVVVLHNQVLCSSCVHSPPIERIWRGNGFRPIEEN